MRPPAADDERGHEKIEQLAEPLHEGRNDERTERCRRSTRGVAHGVAVLFAREAEPEVNAKVKAASRRRSHWCRPRRGNGRRNGRYHETKQATPCPASHEWQRQVSLPRKEKTSTFVFLPYLRFKEAYLRFYMYPSALGSSVSRDLR